MLTLERIDTLERLQNLESDWNFLFQRCPHRTPFLSHEWMVNYWKHFGKGKQLSVVVIRDQEQPLLIAPLMKYWGRLQNRYLKLPAIVLETIANYHSNRVDFLYERLEPVYLDLLWEHLLKDSWHFLRLFPILNDSPTTAGFQELIRKKGIRAVFTHSHSSPYLPVQGSWAEFENSLPKEIRSKSRKADRSKWVTKVYQSESIPDLERILEQIFEVSERGWAAQQGTAISSPELKGFYSDLAALANENGWLFFALLFAEDKPIAYEYNLLFDQTVYNLKIGYDPDFKKYSPGQVLKYAILSQVFSSRPDIAEYDFLGDAPPYKLLWAQQTRRHLKTYIYHPDHFYSKILRTLQAGLRLHPSMKRKVVWSWP